MLALEMQRRMTLAAKRPWQWAGGGGGSQGGGGRRCSVWRADPGVARMPVATGSQFLLGPKDGRGFADRDLGAGSRTGRERERGGDRVWGACRWD